MKTRYRPSPDAVNALRCNAGFSMRELAERAGISTATLWRLEAEKGTTRMPTLRKIASALAVPVATLLVSVEDDVA